MKTLLLLNALYVGAAAVGLAASAHARSLPCAAREDVLGRLGREFGEYVVARGLTTSGNLLEIAATADGRTWTIIVSMPEGATCLVAAGEAWQTVEPRARGESM